MAKIYNIKKNGATVYPRTVSDAVAVVGDTLTDALNKKADKEEIVQEWFGTQAEFDALNTYNENTNYYII